MQRTRLTLVIQEVQLSRRDRAMHRVIKYFDKSSKVTRNYTLE